jgi:hypothetical protein
MNGRSTASLFALMNDEIQFSHSLGSPLMHTAHDLGERSESEHNDVLIKQKRVDWSQHHTLQQARSLSSQTNQPSTTV